MTTNQKLHALRLEMAKHQLSAYLIPSSDPHQSEYVADHWKVREWISNFTGSTALVVVTPDHAGLWTDSRYFIQAEKELADSEIELHKLQVPHTPEHISWLVENLPANSRIGCDGALFSVKQIRRVSRALHSKNIELDHNIDLFPAIWPDRPALPAQATFDLSADLAGESREGKLDRIRKEAHNAGAQYHLVSDLADIAWILNIRSSDIEFNPVVIAYLLIGPKLSYLFIDEKKVGEPLKAILQKDGVVLKPYLGIKGFVQQLEEGSTVLLDPRVTSIDLYQSLVEERIVRGDNPSVLMRSIKNETEIQHIKEAMQKDGVALIRLYRWIEKELQDRNISEVEVAEKLASLRASQGDYHSESFPAIVGYAGNGAIVHYRPMPENCAHLQASGILLLDSGAQYHKGTTDITRTTALGSPTAEQKRNFTLVLKGHIGLARLRFPYGTRGNQMEILARQHLWEYGLNYGHGTGHGVGFFLNVHEGPQSMGGGMSAKAATIFEPGMLTSNEPGYYEPGHYGIRIENLILCVEDQETDYGRFLKFDTVTLFPIDKSLIATELLTNPEKDWLDTYHQKVQEGLAPFLDAEEQEWLKQACAPLT